MLKRFFEGEEMFQVTCLGQHFLPGGRSLSIAAFVVVLAATEALFVRDNRTTDTWKEKWFPHQVWW